MKNYRIYIVSAIALIIGFAAAWFFKPAGEKGSSEVISSQETIWTCSMHPQIRQNEPGLCPICAMDLIPLETEMSSDEGQFSMTEESVKLANIQTITVGKSSDSQGAQKLNGEIQADETRSASLVAHIPGRIERLYVSFTGEEVKAGQKIADIYSPELVAAQKELLELKKFESSNPSIFQSAKQKLKNWKISETQINSILERGTVVETFAIYADKAGVVVSKEVNTGDYIRSGQVLFRVQDLRKLWVLFDVYESDLSKIQLNDDIEFSTASVPSKIYEAKVRFIDPSVNSKTRVARVRAEIDNSGGKLKPGMFVKGYLQSNERTNEEIYLPGTAILWTGKRSVVYIKTEAEIPTYEFREVTLGSSTSDGYFIESGIENGDEVVVNGAFVIDAASQLNNSKSMMNRDVSVKQHAGHSHHGSANTKSEELKVYGNCSMCKKTIESSLKGLEGLYHADWDQERKMLNVNYDPEKISLEELSEKISQSGYDTELHRADEEVYNSLPKCCRFDRSPPLED